MPREIPSALALVRGRFEAMLAGAPRTVSPLPSLLRGRLGTFFIVVALFVVGVLPTLRYGRRGYMPLDQSIVFDGAWRILSGQVPYRDFTTPNGLPPILIQAVVFKLFGISWFTYVMHAAVFNGLFCVLIYALLRQVRSPRVLAVFYAGLSALIFYPPIGTPFMEQHSFFFLLLAVVLAVHAVRTPTPGNAIITWFLVALAAVVAVFGKQMPGLLAGPVLLAIAFSRGRTVAYRALIGMSAGVFFAAGLVLLISLIAGIGPSVAVKSYFITPFTLGTHRFAVLVFPSYYTYTWRLVTPWLVYVGGLVLVIFLWAGWYRAQKENRLRTGIATGALIFLIGTGVGTALLSPLGARLSLARLLLGAVLSGMGMLIAHRFGRDVKLWVEPDPDALLASSLALGLLICCSLFTVVTFNQDRNGVPYLLASAGLINVAALLALGPRSRSPSGRDSRTLVAILVTSVLLVAATADGYDFLTKEDRTREVNDMAFELPLPAVASSLPPELSFMQWQLPPAYTYSPKDLRAATAYLRHAPGNFMLVGDTTILYALTGKPSTSPVLWLHVGLTYPTPGSAGFADFDQTLAAAIIRHDVRRLVVEGQRMEDVLVTFPSLRHVMVTQGCTGTDFGMFKVTELCPKRVEARANRQ